MKTLCNSAEFRTALESWLFKNCLFRPKKIWNISPIISVFFSWMQILKFLFTFLQLGKFLQKQCSCHNTVKTARRGDSQLKQGELHLWFQFPLQTASISYHWLWWFSCRMAGGGRFRPQNTFLELKRKERGNSIANYARVQIQVQVNWISSASILCTPRGWAHRCFWSNQISYNL